MWCYTRSCMKHQTLLIPGQCVAAFWKRGLTDRTVDISASHRTIQYGVICSRRRGKCSNVVLYIISLSPHRCIGRMVTLRHSNIGDYCGRCKANRTSDLVGLEWSGFGGQIHFEAPEAPRTLNLNRTNGYL